FVIDSPYASARLTNSHAEFGFLARDQILAVPVRQRERRRANERVATAMGGFANGRVPFHIGPAVVDVSCRIVFAPAAANDGYIRMLFGEANRGGKPVPGQLTIAVDELNELQIRTRLEQVTPPGVASAGSCE